MKELQGEVQNRCRKAPGSFLLAGFYAVLEKLLRGCKVEGLFQLTVEGEKIMLKGFFFVGIGIENFCYDIVDRLENSVMRRLGFRSLIAEGEESC